jgi:hypothetical protein
MITGRESNPRTKILNRRTNFEKWQVDEIDQK